MAVLDGAPLYATPDDAWNVLLLVLNYGGGDAAGRLAGDRDSLSAIRRFIKFAPDWRALEVVLGTPRAPGMVFSWAPTRTFYQEPAFSAITPAMMVEYARFLGLFKGVPHGLLSPPPSWPRLLDEYGDPSRGSNFLQRIWRFHSKQDSYAQDCLALTGREIPYYEYEDSPTWLHRGLNRGKDAGLMGYRRLYKRYVQAYGTPRSNLWPDVTALVILANKCQRHLDEWRGYSSYEVYVLWNVRGGEEVEYNCDDFWDD